MQLETISEHFQVISNYNEKIPQIELDLIKEQIRNVYDNLNLLEKLNLLDKTKEFISLNEPDSESFTKTEPPKNEHNLAKAEENHMLKAEIKSIKDNISDIQKEFEKKPPSPPKISFDLFEMPQPTIAEKYAETSNSLNDNILKQQKEKNLAEQLQLKHIESLKAVVGINDKFLFINELFEGNMREYDIAITQLDNFHSYNETLEYINQMKEKFDWNTNSSSLVKLKEFLKRRYPQQ